MGGQVTLRVFIKVVPHKGNQNSFLSSLATALKVSPDTKHIISRWLVDAITIAYSSLGLQCPIGVRAHSTRGIASSWAWSSGVSISEICEADGWSSPSTFVRFYSLNVPALQARVLSALISNLMGSLDQHCSSPSFTWSVHIIWTPGINFTE